MRRWLFCGVLLLWLSRVSAQVYLNPNEPVEGIISNGRAETYQFVARQGAMWSFYVQSADATLDPFLRITDLEGNVLALNGDAIAPTVADEGVQDAVIEGFTAPRNGTYRVSILSQDNRDSGAYSLVMLPGYANIAQWEDFGANPIWQTLLENTGTPLVEVLTDQGYLNVVMSGAAQTSITALGDNTTVFDDYYTSVEVLVNAPRGWQAGLSLRQRDDQNYYLYKINSDGQWRFSVLQAGTEVILQDWVRHPAVSGRPDFTLSALVNDNVIELFYEGEFIAEFTDSTFAQAGRIGFFVATPDHPSLNAVNVEFDDFLVTTPLRFNNQGVFPEAITPNNGEFMVRELRRRNLLPSGGAMILANERYTVQDVEAGVRRFPLIEGEFHNVAFGAWVNWAQERRTQLSGCGIALHVETDVTRYNLAFVQSDGSFGFQHREPDTFLPGLFQMDTFATNRVHLVAIAMDNWFYLYVDGIYRGRTEIEQLAAGGVELALLNEQEHRTVCTFQDAWLWSMD